MVFYRRLSIVVILLDYSDENLKINIIVYRIYSIFINIIFMRSLSKYLNYNRVIDFILLLTLNQLNIVNFYTMSKII